MKASSRIFAGIGVLALAITLTYWVVGEATGLKIMLTAFTAALFFYALYFDRIAASHALPEDDPEATQSSTAGQTVGFFPLRSVFPLVFVLGGAVFAYGLIFGFAMWATGAGLTLFAVIGLVAESRE